MSYTVAEYLELMWNLLPRGAVWPRDSATVQGQTLAALAAEWARLDGRADDLWDESDPRQTAELLTDWERLLGLPDDCMLPTVTTADRRTALLGRLTMLGGQSRAFFIALADSLGWEITITEFDAFRVGRNRVGEPLRGEQWKFVWQVNVANLEFEYFRVGQNRVGDPLRWWGSFNLPCIFERLKPAHTFIIWEFSDV